MIGLWDGVLGVSPMVVFSPLSDLAPNLEV